MAARCDSGWAQNASPESYGTLSHLCASVAHESARSRPATRCRWRGDAAAQRPNAPSTWNHAPTASAASAIAARSSQAPVLTLPACPLTIVGASERESTSGRSSARIRPWPSAGTVSICSEPSPRNRSARSTVTCRSSPTTTRSLGAPCSPSRSTSQPRAASTWCRAAASAVRWASWQPVTKPALTCSGRPSSSRSHASETSSTTAALGPPATSPAFWSHADVSQSAATAAGSAPPMTNPKYRLPAIPTSPGSAAATSSATTCSAGVGPSGSAPPSACRSSCTLASARTGRSSTAPKYCAA